MCAAETAVWAGFTKKCFSLCLNCWRFYLFIFQCLMQLSPNGTIKLSVKVIPGNFCVLPVCKPHNANPP